MTIYFDLTIFEADVNIFLAYIYFSFSHVVVQFVNKYIKVYTYLSSKQVFLSRKMHLSNTL